MNWKDDESLALFFSSTRLCAETHILIPSSSTAPSGRSCRCNGVVVYHWTSDANLCFALALCPLGCCSHHLLFSLPSVLSIVFVWPVTNDFTPLFFLKYSFWTLSHLPPFPLFSFSPSFLMLVMSALACFGVTNHPLQNLRAKSKRPPTQKPCITIGCFLLATTYLALCLLLCVRPLACPALPWLAAASSCPLCDWLCWWRTCSSPKYGLLADRYHFCEKCFNEIQGENVSLGDDPSQPQT